MTLPRWVKFLNKWMAKTLQIYYFTVYRSRVQWAPLVPLLIGPMAGALDWRLWGESASHAHPGFWQNSVPCGCRTEESHSLSGCQTGALLSNKKPLGLLVMLLYKLKDHGVFSTLLLSLMCPSVALLLLPARRISLLFKGSCTGQIRLPYNRIIS